jgi:Large polyvalent protein associated domain 29
MSAPTRTRPHYLTCAETATLVRQALKARFPRTRFSVRSHTYSGGASIDVRWTDGPTVQQVQAVTVLYQGASLDGMIDLKTTHSSILVWEEGEPRLVRFGADFILCHRDISAEWEAGLEEEFTAYAGEPFDPTRRYPISTFVDEGAGVGLALNSWQVEYGSTLVIQLAALRDRSRACEHAAGGYGTGSGRRCLGCGEAL